MRADNAGACCRRLGQQRKWPANGGHQSSNTRTSVPLAICDATYSSNGEGQTQAIDGGANHQVRVAEDQRSGHIDRDCLAVFVELPTDTRSERLVVKTLGRLRGELRQEPL